jgi:hypothetical protein
MWRHGDVLLAKVEALPAGAKPHAGATLAYGEVTGHSHRFADPESVELFMGLEGLLFVRVIGPSATLIHEEHQPITIPQGVYRVWQQREYSPHAIRAMLD